jgi:hypothetical protein
MRRAVDRTGLASTGLAGTGLALAGAAAGLLLAWPAGPALAAQASARSAAPAAAQPGAGERFHLISRNPTSRRAKLEATGALTADGYALAGDFASHHGVSHLVFSAGALRLVTKETQASQSVPNPATCTFTEVFSGRYVIRGGAGSYQNASGSGSYVSRISGQLKMASGGGCGTQLVYFRQSTRTAGSLHL